MEENKETIEYYKKHAAKYYAQTVDVDMSPVYKDFLYYLDTGAHILDAGCGSGRDSLYFLEEGYEITALDAAEELACLAQELLGQKVLKMRLQDLDFKAEFDGIWASASLLHLREEQIKEVLKRFTAALLPQGVVYISLKYGTKEEFKEGRFFNYYREDSFLQLLAEIAGLEVIKLWKTSDAEKREATTWLNLLLKKVT
ncbi:MAG: class I SAM-dependent methyltransferase [Halanaerobacter sp.]